MRLNSGLKSEKILSPLIYSHCKSSTTLSLLLFSYPHSQLHIQMLLSVNAKQPIPLRYICTSAKEAKRKLKVTFEKTVLYLHKLQAAILCEVRPILFQNSETICNKLALVFTKEDLISAFQFKELSILSRT